MTTTPATLNSFKTENQIYKDFKSCVEAALLHFGITGWEVKKLNQVIKTEDLKTAVFIQSLFCWCNRQKFVSRENYDAIFFYTCSFIY